MVTAFFSLLTLVADTTVTLLHIGPIADNHGSNVITIWNRVTLPGPSAKTCTIVLACDVKKESPTP